MAKTNYTDGSFLTPTVANMWWAHVHDGVDADGHVEKIDLTSQVSGALPLANMTRIPLSGANIGVTGLITQEQTTGMNYVDRTTAQSVTGIKGFGDTTYFKSLELHGASSDYQYYFAPSTVVSMPANSYARSWKVSTGVGLNEYHVGGYIYSATSISDTYVIPLTSFGCSASAAAYHVDIAFINSSSAAYGWVKGTCPNTSFTSFGGNNTTGHGSVANGAACLGYSSGVKLWFQYSSNAYIFRFQGVIREITASWD